MIGFLKIAHSEKATISAFVLEGSELKAEITFDGPIGEDPDLSTAALREAEAKLDRRRRDDKHQIHFRYALDFDELNLIEEEEEEEDMYDLDDEEEFAGDDEEEMQRLAMKRRKALEKKHHKRQKAKRQARKVREEGEAYQKTFEARLGGFYRFCLHASSVQVVAEIDLRKESELGGIDKDTGHVWTFEQKMFAQEEVLLEEDTADEEGIKDEDFEKTKEKFKTLRRLLADVQTRQEQERHRLVMHAKATEHSHSKMVLGSLFETIVYMVVTGVQIMTIRHWFKAAPMLGR